MSDLYSDVMFLKYANFVTCYIILLSSLILNIFKLVTHFTIVFRYRYFHRVFSDMLFNWYAAFCS
jgi:hypothetical protein